MIEKHKSKFLKKTCDSLIIKYNMFFLNRQYKKEHFKTDKEYSIIQKNLSSEIESVENEVKNIIKEWLTINFENVIFIAYDSRFICITENIKRIGKVLIKNANNKNLQKRIEEMFQKDTEFEIIIEAYEDLPEEVQKKFTF